MYLVTTKKRIVQFELNFVRKKNHSVSSSTPKKNGVAISLKSDLGEIITGSMFLGGLLFVESKKST